MGRQVLTIKDLRMKWLAVNLSCSSGGPTYTDEYIERWGSVYLANPMLRLLGCPFSTFLGQPEKWLQFIGNPMRDHPTERRPYVLSSKEQLILREALRRSSKVVGNGRLVEKLRHRRHPKSKRDFTPLVEA